MRIFINKLNLDFNFFFNFQNCLKWKPEDRPTAEELLKGEYLKDISTPTKNADFFRKMTKYLDEQFKKISLTLGKG